MSVIESLEQKWKLSSRFQENQYILLESLVKIKAHRFLAHYQIGLARW